ncbi:MAG: sulfite oxidase [Actinomycetota bacterium]|nr:sulfite oxidase [Actinomycetota bacterium]MDQ6949338.1 sulfite oxidase [Actinomycetota bacterium]
MSLWDKREDMIVHEEAPFNAEPPRMALAHNAVTPTDTFYARNHGPIPDIDSDSWRLRVDGLTDRALELSLTDLQETFPVHGTVATLQCAGNRRAGLIEVRDIPGEDPWGPGATSTALWAGTRLADVLSAAGLQPDARYVAFEAPDVTELADPPQRFGGSITAKKATAGEVLLAWTMNDQPLPRVHGAPVRVVVPGYIGARSVKWVNRITAQRQSSTNYFQASAYRLLPAEADPSAAGPEEGLQLGAIAVNADILRPDDGAHLRAGPVTVEGYAFAGDDRGIARVDVSADGGRRWTQAHLGQHLGPWAWRLWHTTLNLPEGETVLTARAWDTAAAVQPEHAQHLWNPKGYVNNSWAHVHVTVHKL